MPNYTTESIRTIALVGHGAAGKTSLAEALLHAAGSIPQKGMVEKGNTVCDFDPLEKTAGHSLYSAIAHCEYENTRIHLVDTPGYPDFAGSISFRAVPSKARESKTSSGSIRMDRK